MNRFRRCFVVVCFVSLSAHLTFAKEPPAPAQNARPRGPRPNPTNIKALPKDITGDEVIKLMRQYEGDLGVECEYCHARNPETKRNDFPSDANPAKEKARIMIRMTDDLKHSKGFLLCFCDNSIRRHGVAVQQASCFA